MVTMWLPCGYHSYPLEQELVACKEVYDKLPRTDSLASSWPRVRQKEALVVEECDEVR